MTTRQAVARNALEPTGPPIGRTIIVATDMDRTFTTSSLELDPECLRRVRTLRRAGILTVLVTGRRASDVPMARLRDCFDAMVLEGGAIWGRPGDWTIPAVPPSFWRLAEDLAANGHDVREGWASFSIPLESASALPATSLHTQWVNVDRIDVTMPGVDKAAGLTHAISDLRVNDPWVMGIGDGANDVPVANVVDQFVAVANADPALQSAAHTVAPKPASKGFLWATQHLEA